MENKSSFNILFYIKKTKLLKNGEAPLFLKLTQNKKSIEFSLHHSLNKGYWSSDYGKVTANTKEALLSSKFIDSVKYRIQSIINELNSNNEEITIYKIKEKYLGIKKVVPTILNEFQKHNNLLKTRINIDSSYGTYKMYNTTYNHLKEFLKTEYNSNDIPIDNINYNFITQFEHYLKVQQQCAHNTTMKNLIRLKKVYNELHKKGLTLHEPFKIIKLTMHKVNKEFLTEHELEKIINKTFYIERLNYIKHCFLFSCFTGLAYTEIKNLKSENVVLGIDGHKWISIIRQKSKENNKCNVPILPFAQDILDKYADHPIVQTKGFLLPVPSNQKMNSYLKEIADLCGITKNLTSHIARHTFATTVTLNNGVPIESVSKMLGHSSLKTTKIYAKLLDERISKDMQNIKKIYSNL